MLTPEEEAMRQEWADKGVIRDVKTRELEQKELASQNNSRHADIKFLELDIRDRELAAKMAELVLMDRWLTLMEKIHG